MPSPPTIRLLSCHTCGHRLRFGADRCGACGARAPRLNSFGFLIGLVAVAGLVGLLGVLARSV